MAGWRSAIRAYSNCQSINLNLVLPDEFPELLPLQFTLTAQ